VSADLYYSKGDSLWSWCKFGGQRVWLCDEI